MRSSSERGFTVIEVLIAVTVLSVGVLAMLQSSAGVTGMLRDGRQRSRAVAIATTRLETLRQQAISTTPTCTALSGGSATTAGRFQESWTVSGSGFSRSVVVTVSYPLGTHSSSQTVRTAILCQ